MDHFELQPLAGASSSPDAAPAEPTEPTPVDASVANVHYHKEETGWTILTVDRAGQPEPWIGVMPSVTEGMKVRATGAWEDSDKHGRQFRVQSLIVLMPEASDPDALSSFLSKLVKGVGDRLAWRIVDTLGDDTIRCLENDAEKIATVRGVSIEKARELSAEWNKHSIEGQLIVQLARYGLRGHIAKKVIKRFGGRSVEVCSNEPYLLAIEVDGIGWKTADTIAKAVGISLDAITRIEAGILHVFDEKFYSRGHCFAEQGPLLAHASKLLDLGMDKLLVGLEALEQRMRITREGARVYSSALYHAEVRVAERVTRLVTAHPLLRRWQSDPMDPMSDGIPEADLPEPERMAELAEQAIEAFEKRIGSALAEVQREAVRAAMQHKVLVITGGPGVGKSTIARAIVHAMSLAGFDIVLGAPTGRAAKRLSETTGRPATTIHRMLEFDPREGGFARNAGRRLEQTVLILDECSMLELSLAASVLEALDDGARIILFGDVDQLPSVGPGAVLRDIIDSGVVHVVRLTQIFRQAEGSRIITNAHRVNRGEMPERNISGESDFYWIERTEAEMAQKLCLRIITERLANRGISTRDAVVIVPQKGGTCGVHALNKKLQEVLNPSGHCIVLGKAPKDIIYRVGDRVMQLKNDKERAVFNGEVGWISSVDPEKSIIMVDMEGASDEEKREIRYERKHFEHLTHAYASTVHKCQGGSSKAVVIILLREHFMLLSRALLYTALTRGEKLVVLIGDPEAVRMAVSETRRELRNTGLRQRLVETVRAASTPGRTPTSTQALV